jgi:ATP-binding cassette subfamily B protein
MPKQESTKRDKEITRATYKLFQEANLQAKWLLLVAYATRIPAIAAYNVLIPFVSAYAIQAVVNKQFNKVRHYALYIILLSLFYCVCWYIASIAIAKQAVIGSKYIQNSVFSNFLDKDYEFYTNAFFGSLGAQAAQIREAYNTWGELVTLSIPKQVTIAVLSIGIIASQSVVLAAVTIVMIIFVLSFTLLTSSWRLKFRRRTSEASSEVAASIGDALTHGTTVKSFAMEDYEMELLQKPLNLWAKVQYKTWVTYAPADTGRMMLAALATAVLLLFSARLYQEGSISITIVVLIQLYVIRLVASTTDVADIVKRYEEAMGTAYKPLKTMAIPSNIKDPDSPLKLPNTKAHALELDNVSYHYPGAAKQTNAVKNFTLVIKPGEKVGLVGYSGSGKTTITKLLLRFMDISEGSITIDRLDIRHITQKQLRSVVSYVPQEPLLFHRSIAENIAYANPNATQNDVMKAARMAYVDEFVDEFPQGYNTLVGERGVKLSGGQRQRVAIARALLKDSPILVLDEATSALDSKSEKYIQDGLSQLMKNRTSLVIAHRLSTIQRMDRIVVMDKGEIVQNGNHEELLKDKHGIYARLWAHQSGGYVGLPDNNSL